MKKIHIILFLLILLLAFLKTKAPDSIKAIQDESQRCNNGLLSVLYCD